MSVTLLEAQRAKSADEGGARARYDSAQAAYEAAQAEFEGLESPFVPRGHQSCRGSRPGLQTGVSCHRRVHGHHKGKLIRCLQADLGPASGNGPGNPAAGTVGSSAWAQG